MGQFEKGLGELKILDQNWQQHQNSERVTNEKDSIKAQA